MKVQGETRRGGWLLSTESEMKMKMIIVIVVIMTSFIDIIILIYKNIVVIINDSYQ